MSEPLPYTIPNEEVQGNFDALAKLFPLARKNMKIETPHLVGGSGEPAFENSWVNYSAGTHQAARFWKDPMDMVHVEGLVKNGTVGGGGVVFTLPAGYRPAAVLIYATDTGTGYGRVDVAADGKVTAVSGGNGNFSINLSFKQEQ